MNFKPTNEWKSSNDWIGNRVIEFHPKSDTDVYILIDTGGTQFFNCCISRTSIFDSYIDLITSPIEELDNKRTAFENNENLLFSSEGDSSDLKEFIDFVNSNILDESVKCLLLEALLTTSSSLDLS